MPSVAPAAVAVVAALASSTMAVAAQPAADEFVRHVEPGGVPGSWVGMIVLPPGGARLAVVGEWSLSVRTVGEPWAFGVDAVIGLSPRLTLGLGHSARALGTVNAGGGWCVASAAHECPRRYDGGYLDARWRARDRRPYVVVLARLGAEGLGPLKPATRLGVSLRTWRGPLWVAIEPEIAVSLGHRELGNRDALIAPVWVGVGHDRVAAWLRTGVRGQTVGFTDKVEIVVGLGAGVRLGGWRVAAEVAAPRLLGPQNTPKVSHAAMWIERELGR